MATDNITPICAGPSEPDPFDALYDRMQEQLDALRCVRAVLDSSAFDNDEDLIAARGLFHQTFRELDRLHDELATWNMATRKEARS